MLGTGVLALWGGCSAVFFHQEEPGGCCLEGVFPAHRHVIGIIYSSIRGAGNQFSERLPVMVL